MRGKRDSAGDGESAMLGCLCFAAVLAVVIVAAIVSLVRWLWVA